MPVISIRCVTQTSLQTVSGGVGVAVGVSVSVGLTFGVAVSVGVAVGVAISVGVAVGVAISVGVAVSVAVSVGFTVGVAVSVGFTVGVAVSVEVADDVAVSVEVADGVAVGGTDVGVGGTRVGVSVPVGLLIDVDLATAAGAGLTGGVGSERDGVAIMAHMIPPTRQDAPIPADPIITDKDSRVIGTRPR